MRHLYFFVLSALAQNIAFRNQFSFISVNQNQKPFTIL